MVRCVLASLCGLLFGCAPVPSAPAPQLTRIQGFNRILALPEIRQLAIYYPMVSAGEVGLTVMEDGDEAPGIWTYYVGEDHSTHTVRTYTVSLSSFTGEISVWDWVRDEYVGLAEWRKSGNR
jgi:hypothetical protein